MASDVIRKLVHFGGSDEPFAGHKLDRKYASGNAHNGNVGDAFDRLGGALRVQFHNSTPEGSNNLSVAPDRGVASIPVASLAVAFLTSGALWLIVGVVAW